MWSPLNVVHIDVDKKLESHSLTYKIFLQMRMFLSCLSMDLQVDQLGTLEESINYAEESVSSLLYLTLEAVNVSCCWSENV